MIDIEERHLTTIKHILQQHLPNVTVWAFGSRVTLRAKPYSDLDLVIIGDKAIPQKLYYQIQDAMEESDIPFKVDLLDWHRITPQFRTIIEGGYTPILVSSLNGK